MSGLLGLIPTIEEDDNAVVPNDESSESDEDAIKIKSIKKSVKKKAAHRNKSDDFNEKFEFVEGEADEALDWSILHTVDPSVRTTLDEKISRLRKLHRTKGATNGKVVDAEGSNTVGKDVFDEMDISEEEDDEEEEITPKTDTVKTKEKKKRKAKPKKGQKNEDEDEVQAEEPKIQYKDVVTTYTEANDFSDMNLSRPIMKALTGLGWTKPTPIQIATVPLALLGNDICACAATGTGKTGAFMLPVLERLLYRPKQVSVTRVLVLTPTRELAVQIYQVSCQLAQYTNIEISLSAGGLDVKAQEAALRLGPDVVIATPGRLIDHIHNAPSFNLQSVEVLILDEADRMLDEYFAEQMKEVLRLCSRTRQTMLFSATMTEQVKDLAAVSLNNPVKVYVNQNKDVAFNLRQEFVRVRENREGDREAIIAALIKRTFHDHCIVFIQTKKHAHRMHVLLGLLGVRVGELHGNLTQPQRLEALRQFKEAEIDVLMATDLAARGLDIEDVKTVINVTMPNSIEHYIHRVGRTARAGKSGRSVTLVGEKERKMLREIVKRATLPVKSRVVPQEVISKYRDLISRLEEDIHEVDRLEAEEKELRVTELKVNKAQRLIEHQEEIMSRPKRTWFQTHQERKQDQAAQRLTKLDLGKKKNKNKKTITPTDRVEFDLMKAAAYANRAAKKQLKDKRIRACAEDYAPAKKKSKKSTSSFSKELTSTGTKALRKYRQGGSTDAKYGNKGKSGKGFKSTGGGGGKKKFGGKPNKRR